MTSIVGTLTTIFTPPSSCFGLTSVSSYSQLWLGFGSACEPGTEATVGYYSPGICPSGYTSACPIGRSSLYNVESVTEFTLGPAELGHRCCPRYASSVSTSRACLLIHTAFSGFSCLASDWFPYLCQGSFSPPTTVPYWVNGRYADESTVVATGGGTVAQAWAICVKWKTDDLTLFPAAVAATLETSEPLPTTTSGGPVITATPTNPIATTTATASGVASLPKSTKIVVGVLVPLVLICILAAICIYFHRRRWTEPVDSNPSNQLHLDDIQQPGTYKVQGFGDVSPPAAYRAQSPGNVLSLPVLPAGADLSMGQERWERSVEMPVPESQQGGGVIYPGYLRKLRGSGY
jgi:hypothetical protein